MPFRRSTSKSRLNLLYLFCSQCSGWVLKSDVNKEKIFLLKSWSVFMWLRVIRYLTWRDTYVCVCVWGLELTQCCCDLAKYFYGRQSRCAADYSVVFYRQVDTHTCWIPWHWIDVWDFIHTADTDPALSICLAQKHVVLSENWIITHFSVHIPPLHRLHAEQTSEKEGKGSSDIKSHSKREKGKYSDPHSCGWSLCAHSVQLSASDYLGYASRDWCQALRFTTRTHFTITPHRCFYLFFWGSSQTNSTD